MHQPTKIITAASLFLLLSACGGGGGSSPGTSAGSPSDTTGAPGSTGTNTGTDKAGSEDTANNPGATAPAFAYDETARFNGPRGVRTDAAGNVYVLDGGTGLIRKIAPTGAVSSLPQLPSGVTVDGLEVDAAGNVYVTNKFNGEIFKMTPAGTVSVIATIVNARHPAVDAQGNLYVLAGFDNADKTLIQRITPAGEVSTVYTGSDSSAQHFGLTVDAAGNLYTITRIVTTTHYEGKIVKISPTGEATDLAPFSFRIYPDDNHVQTRITNMAVDAGGNLYVAHYREHLPSKWCTEGNCLGFYESGMSIDKITPAGITTRVRTGPPGSTGRLEVAYDYDRNYGMSYIDVGNDGNIYASYAKNHTVYRISQSGETTLIAGKPGEAGSAD
jgi:streptogramin lyase